MDGTPLLPSGVFFFFVHVRFSFFPFWLLGLLFKNDICKDKKTFLDAKVLGWLTGCKLCGSFLLLPPPRFKIVPTAFLIFVQEMCSQLIFRQSFLFLSAFPFFFSHPVCSARGTFLLLYR
ncbi:unnamed protein product [Ixodes pacificus]